jgi:hypothetical protein
MPPSTTQAVKLKKIIGLAQDLLAEIDGKTAGRDKKALLKSSGKRRRRSGNELAAFRKLLKSERKRGVPVVELARRHSVSTAYIYQMG